MSELHSFITLSMISLRISSHSRTCSEQKSVSSQGALMSSTLLFSASRTLGRASSPASPVSSSVSRGSTWRSRLIFTMPSCLLSSMMCGVTSNEVLSCYQELAADTEALCRVTRSLELVPQLQCSTAVPSKPSAADQSHKTYRPLVLSVHLLSAINTQ